MENAQGSIEYLLIIGAAVIIAVIVIALMMGLSGEGTTNVEAADAGGSYIQLYEEQAHAKGEEFIPAGETESFVYAGDDIPLAELLGDNLSDGSSADVDNPGADDDYSATFSGGEWSSGGSGTVSSGAGVSVSSGSGGHSTIPKDDGLSNEPEPGPCSSNTDCEELHAGAYPEYENYWCHWETLECEDCGENYCNYLGHCYRDGEQLVFNLSSGPKPQPRYVTCTTGEWVATLKGCESNRHCEYLRDFPGYENYGCLNYGFACEDCGENSCDYAGLCYKEGDTKPGGDVCEGGSWVKPVCGDGDCLYPAENSGNCLEDCPCACLKAAGMEDYVFMSATEEVCLDTGSLQEYSGCSYDGQTGYCTCPYSEAFDCFAHSINDCSEISPAHECSFEVNDEATCSSLNGKWVDTAEIEDWQIDLGIYNTEDCVLYGGSCSSIRILSSTTIGSCDNGIDCWYPDFHEDTCLLPQPTSSIIDSCGEISEPGYYVLTEDLMHDSGQGEACILIASDNVSFDGTGHTILGSGGATSGVWAMGRSGVQIGQINVGGFKYGIYIDDGSVYNTISGVNAGEVLGRTNEYGIFLGITQNTFVTESTIESNNYGVYAVTGGEGSSLENNTICYNAFDIQDMGDGTALSGMDNRCGTYSQGYADYGTAAGCMFPC